MYKFHYEDILQDESSGQRDRERQAVEYSISMLRRAKDKGRNSMEALEALAFVNRLWGFLIEELARPDNALPVELRAKLISIGLWLIREADAIGDGKSENFVGLIDVSQTIADGLR